MNVHPGLSSPKIQNTRRGSGGPARAQLITNESDRSPDKPPGLLTNHFPDPRGSPALARAQGGRGKTRSGASMKQKRGFIVPRTREIKIPVAAVFRICLLILFAPFSIPLYSIHFPLDRSISLTPLIYSLSSYRLIVIVIAQSSSHQIGTSVFTRSSLALDAPSSFRREKKSDLRFFCIRSLCAASRDSPLSAPPLRPSAILTALLCLGPLH